MRARLHRPPTGRARGSLLALTLLAWAGSAPAQNLLVNGGFEEPVIVGVEFRGAIPGWVETTGFGIEIHRGALGAPADGAQYVELDSNGSSSIVQEVPTTAGASYDIRLAFSARPNVASNVAEVWWDGALLDTIAADGTGQTGTRWELHVYTVTASTALTPLRLTDRSAPDTVGTFVDDICVSAATIPPAAGCAGPCRAEIGTRSPLAGCEGQRLRLLPVRARVDGCTGVAEYRWTRGAAVLQDWAVDPTYFHDVQPFDDLLQVELRCSDEPTCAASGEVLIEPFVSAPPPEVGPLLRVTRPGGAVRLSWQGATLSPDLGHFHAWASDQPDSGFLLLDHSLLLTATNWIDPDPAGPLRFYDVRSGDACENESAD